MVPGPGAYNLSRDFKPTGTVSFDREAKQLRENKARKESYPLVVIEDLISQTSEKLKRAKEERLDRQLASHRQGRRPPRNSFGRSGRSPPRLVPQPAPTLFTSHDRKREPVPPRRRFQPVKPNYFSNVLPVHQSDRFEDGSMLDSPPPGSYFQPAVWDTSTFNVKYFWKGSK